MPAVCSHWAGTHMVRGDSLRLCQGWFRLSIGKNFFNKKAVQPWHPSVGVGTLKINKFSLKREDKLRTIKNREIEQIIYTFRKS